MSSVVSVPPEIILPNRRLGQSLGRETILECIISASQPVSYYWEKDGHKFLTVPTDRHRLEAFDDGDHELVLSLRISDLQRSDYGQYDCHASNRLGTVRKSMQLYGIHTLNYVLIC
jgi:hypothetical protein